MRRMELLISMLVVARSYCGEVFDCIAVKTIVSWNSMIGGYARVSNFEGGV